MYCVPYSVQLVCVIVWTPPTLILPFFPSCPPSLSHPPSPSLTSLFPTRSSPVPFILPLPLLLPSFHSLSFLLHSSFIPLLLFPSVFSSSPRPPSLHPLYPSLHSLSQARHAGQHKRKWLLVNVQDSNEFASQVLNRDVWSNHNVKDIIRQHFLFWQVCACSYLTQMRPLALSLPY